MSWHVHPILRFRETAAIDAGLLVNLDSVGFTVVKNQEAAGLRPTVTPDPRILVLNGVKYTPTTV